MISTLQAARLCAELYAERAADWSHYWSAEQIVCAHRAVGEDQVLTFMGSKSATDWMRDAEGWPSWDDELGFVHCGFLDHMDTILPQVIKDIGTGPLTIVGHSLGGARARIAAATLAFRNVPVASLITFGSPKPGFANLARIIQKSGMAHQSWRNRNDPVPLVPGILPWWEHTEAYGTFDEHSAGGDLSPLRDHHIELYIAGAAKLAESTATQAS